MYRHKRYRNAHICHVRASTLSLDVSLDHNSVTAHCIAAHKSLWYIKRNLTRQAENQNKITAPMVTGPEEPA